MWTGCSGVQSRITAEDVERQVAVTAATPTEEPALLVAGWRGPLGGGGCPRCDERGADAAGQRGGNRLDDQGGHRDGCDATGGARQAVARWADRDGAASARGCSGAGGLRA